MPRSRNSRSKSPLKSLKTTTGQSEYDRIFQYVQEMFSDTVDATVIYFVLSECHWRSEDAIDKLLTIVEKSEASPIKTKSKLQEIAESVLGPLRHDECQEQGHTHPPTGWASATGVSEGSDGSSFERAAAGAFSSRESSSEDLQSTFKGKGSPVSLGLDSRGRKGQQSANALSPETGKRMRPVSADNVRAWELPPLQQDLSDLDLSSSKNLQESSNSTVNESWRAIKAPKSKFSYSSPHQHQGIESELTSSSKVRMNDQDIFSGDANAMRGKVNKPARPRLEMNRNFPVRLLSKSPEETHENITFPQTMHHSLSESVLSKKNKNIAQSESFELDETVIKCISEINHELLHEKEKKTEQVLFGHSRSSSIRSQASENEGGGTGTSSPDPSHVRPSTSTPNNHPMTLPVIGLSVEAPEFVPRPKKTKTEEAIKCSSESVVVTSARCSPISAAALKVDTKSVSNTVPAGSPHQGMTPTIRMGSPRITVVSPGCAISPPSNIPVSNSAHLTGSPMFITPKWQPVFPGVYTSQPPPLPLQPHLVAQRLPQQLPQPFSPGYRYPQAGTQFPAYSGVVYPVGTRPVFHVAGLPPRISQVPMPQNVPMVTEVNDMVAMATGQPIMATREIMKTRRVAPSSLDVFVESVKALTKAGKKIMVIVRGLPGSGKSTLARAIRFDGVVLSTDDYFMKGDVYEYDPNKLTEAHQWNRERAKEAIKMGTSPIIIDNTNTQKWEFKPYVSMALNNNYHVEIMEPDTPWMFNPKELAKRTVHGVPEDQIQRMLSRYEKNLTVSVVSNKIKRPVQNGPPEPQSQNNSSSKENLAPLAVERKPLKSTRVEAARLSRSKAKSKKTKEPKTARKIQNPVSNGHIVGKPEVNELKDWQISEEDKMWERKTLKDPSSVQALENSNAALMVDWTADDWMEIYEHNGDFIICEKSEADSEGPTGSDLTIAPSSGRSSASSIQGEVNFYQHPHSNILSTTSSMTSSPIIEYDISETYIPSDKKHDANFLGTSEEKSYGQSKMISIKELESELSDEILGYVKEVLEEHSCMKLSGLSEADKEKMEDELKALLQFYPIEDDEQRRKAEILIGLKFSESGIPSEITADLTFEEETGVHYIIQENMHFKVTSEQLINGFDENTEAQVDDHILDSNIELSLRNIDNGSVDLDNSLNKEVANILDGAHLHKEVDTSGIGENLVKETILDDSFCSFAGTTELGKEDGNTDNHQIESNRKNTDYYLEQGTCVEPLLKHGHEESISKSGLRHERFYDIDSAIIRAETSDTVESESLFKNDSAVIALGSDSMDRDSLYQTDSAIFAACSDKDVDSLNICKRDSAIISASNTDSSNVCDTDSTIMATGKDLSDTEVVFDDADVMKRLKASVQELKYWGHLESEEETRSVEEVATQWDGCEHTSQDEWQNDINFVSIEAKPQRKRRHKSDSINIEDSVSENRETDEVLRKENQNEETFNGFPVNEMHTLNPNETEGNTLVTVGEAYDYSEDHIYAQSCFNNNSGMFNDVFFESLEGVNFDYAGNEASNILNAAVSDLSQNQFDLQTLVFESKENMDKSVPGTEIDIHKESSETDLENSIFISDDEDNLNKSQVSKSDSEVLKTTSSDDNMFLSDDDTDYLAADLKVDGLQTVTIHEETMPAFDKNIAETLRVTVNIKQEVTAGEKPVGSDMNLLTLENGAHDKEISVIEHIRQETLLKCEEKSAAFGVDISSGNNLTANGLKSSTDMTHQQTGSEMCNVEREGSRLTLLQSDFQNSTNNKEGDTENLLQNQISKKHKISKRKVVAKLSGPFFDISDKEKFALNDWSTLSSSSKGTNIKPVSLKAVAEIDFKSTGTLTESGDFRIFNLFCQGESVEYVSDYKFVRTRSRSIGMNDEELVRCKTELQSSTNREVRKIDKSSSTDDLKTDLDTENIHFLKTCFPNITEDELDCVLINCADNVEWALNLLLDWKYHLDYTNEEKEHFSKEILKCKRYPGPETEESLNEVVTERIPDSLLDMCFKKIELENIAAKEDLEKQLIQTGKDRLDRIEDDNITKIRLRRSTSLNESSFDRSSLSASQSFERVHRSVSDPCQNVDPVLHNSGSELKEAGLSSAGFVLSTDMKTPEETAEQRRSLVNGETEMVIDSRMHVEQADGHSQSAEGNSRSELHQNLIADADQQQYNNFPGVEQVRLIRSPEPIVFTIALDSSIISQLESLFGPVEDNSITDHGDLEVPVNLETARLLHQCIKNGLHDERHLKYKQMKEDEEYARKLQEEEDKQDSEVYQSPSKKPTRSRRGQPVSLAQLSEPKRPLQPVMRREPVKPLTEIMKEEMSKQETQEELQKYLKSEGWHEAMSTRMRRQKLYENFPTMDRTSLDQIFEANCYNLSETIELVQTSLSYQPVKTVMTQEMEEEYDRKLIESIKQQTTQDMLDTLDSFSEDLDDVVDAELEDYRGEAILHHNLRRECFQKAQDAHRKGWLQVAHFYSQQGHLHSQKLKEANMRASEQILEARHIDLETKMTLDLHGLHVDEAIAALDRILPEKEKERYKSHLIIITGRGRHSSRGIPRLRPAVMAYLQKHQYSFTEIHPGAFRVTLKNRWQLKEV